MIWSQSSAQQTASCSGGTDTGTKRIVTSRASLSTWTAKISASSEALLLKENPTEREYSLLLAALLARVRVMTGYPPDYANYTHDPRNPGGSERDHGISTTEIRRAESYPRPSGRGSMAYLRRQKGRKAGAFVCVLPCGYRCKFRIGCRSWF